MESYFEIIFFVFCFSFGQYSSQIINEPGYGDFSISSPTYAYTQVSAAGSKK